MPRPLPRPLAAMALICLVLPAGCGPRSEARATPAARPAPAAATPANAPLTPSGAPKRRAGWWGFYEIGDTSGLPRQQLCVGEASEARFSSFDQIADPSLCSRRDFRRQGQGWTFTTVCDFGAGPVTARGTITGDLTSSYVVAQTVSSDAAGVTTGRIAAKWTGPCPAGKKDGDMVASGVDTSVLGE